MNTTERGRWRRVAAFTVLGVVALTAGCSGGDKGTRVEGVTLERTNASSSTTTTAVTTSTTTVQGLPFSDPSDPSTTTTTATTEAPPATAEPASIEVRYQPAAGDTATATLEGTGRTLSLADGIAVFDGLDDGTYRVILTIEHPTEESDGTGVGSEEILRSEAIALVAGDHAIVSCADACTGIL